LVEQNVAGRELMNIGSTIIQDISFRRTHQTGGMCCWARLGHVCQRKGGGQ
jgi:hypothetical protein